MDTFEGHGVAAATTVSHEPLSILTARHATEALIQDLVSRLVDTQGQVQGSAPGCSDENELFIVGRAALDGFLQANVTGPTLPSSQTAITDKYFTKAWSQQGVPSQKSSIEALPQIRKTCLQSLDIDGVSPYAHIPHIELFCLARHVFVAALANPSNDVISDTRAGSTKQSIAWMRLRVHVWHYKLLTQPSLGPGSHFTRSSQWSDVPTLADRISSSIGTVRSQVIGDEVWSSGDSWSREDRLLFLLEASNSYTLLGRSDQAKETLREAAQASGLEYALSGALGKRTKFQEKSISQLVVLAKSAEEGAATASASIKDAQGDEEEEGATGSSAAKPDALKLNDDTLLEDIHFTKNQNGQDSSSTPSPQDALPASLADLAPDAQPQLSPLDQIILLAEATLKDAFSPLDDLTTEEVLPFAARVLADKSTNWQIYTQALLVRSRIEVHRSRTVERGVLQLQAVADQVLTDTSSVAAQTQQPSGQSGASAENKDAAEVPEIQVTAPDRYSTAPASEKPTTFFPAVKPSESAPADARLRYVHALSTPPRWHLESELAYAWAGVGSLVSALEIFKRLHLWAEVALCLASAGAADDPDGRGSGGEEKARGIVRWRLFHRTGEAVNPSSSSSSSSEAEDDGVKDPTTLKPSDFSGPERSPPPPNAPRLWCILGDLEDDPAHYERAWEISRHRYARAQRSLGEHYLKDKDIERAHAAYKLATAVNRLSPEMWSRLGDISLRLARFDDAAEAYGRSISSATDTAGGEDARTWSNLGSALWSLYCERTAGPEKAAAATATTTELPEPAAAVADDEDEEQPPAVTKQVDPNEPGTLVAKSLAAYKNGAAIAHDNWRIWDNVLTLASRMQPPALTDMIISMRHVVRIRQSEDAVDAAVLGALLHDAVLTKEKDASNGNPSSVYEPPRGSEERLVTRLIEEEVVPLITRRAELWTLVARLRAWRRDFPGAVDASERAWRAATSGSSSSSSSAGLLPGAANEADTVEQDWATNAKAWDEVVQRTDELVSALENWGSEGRWRGKARSAVRSVMGRGREQWEGTEGWKTLERLMEGLKVSK